MSCSVSFYSTFKFLPPSPTIPYSSYFFIPLQDPLHLFLLSFHSLPNSSVFPSRTLNFTSIFSISFFSSATFIISSFFSLFFTTFSIFPLVHSIYFLLPHSSSLPLHLHIPCKFSFSPLTIFPTFYFSDTPFFHLYTGIYIFYSFPSIISLNNYAISTLTLLSLFSLSSGIGRLPLLSATGTYYCCYCLYYF